MTFKLPDLPYSYDALIPYISSETLEFHHDKHHQTYVTNTNNLLKISSMKDERTLQEIIKESFSVNNSLFNNASQHYNHIHLWSWMKKNGGDKKIPEKITNALNNNFGSYEQFRSEFLSSGMSQFGSGWVWLIKKNEKLKIMTTKNGENPLIYRSYPILGIDLWEHAYYIDYRNARQKYLESFIDYLINWDYVLEMYELSENY